VPADGKYPLDTLEILVGLIVEGDMLGKIVAQNFANHDIKDEPKFLELVQEKYLCNKIILGTREILLEPQTWATRLEKSGILNLLENPHFGRSLEINSCVKMILSCVHGRMLWLDCNTPRSSPC
jgi:hypothetical protein